MSVGSLLFAQLARLPRAEFRTDRQRVKVTTRDGVAATTITVRATSKGGARAAKLERMLMAWPDKAEGSRGSARDYFYWWVKGSAPGLQFIIDCCTPKARS